MHPRRRPSRSALITTVLALVLSFTTVGMTPAVAQTVKPLELRVSGPVYAQPGETILYSMAVKNVSGRAVQGVEIYNDIPDDTSHDGGGTFIGDDGVPYTKLTLGSVAPNATVKVTWTARADAGLAVGHIITNSSFGFIDSSQGDAYGDDVLTKVEAPGTVEAIFKNDEGTPFDVATHGYGFENYGSGADVGIDTSNDLSAIDLFTLFGDDVCKTGNTAATCKLTAAATKWRDAQLESMAGGHCEGLAATSLRMFEELPYLGLPGTPTRFQSGTTDTIDLTVPNQAIENYIAHYWVTQSVGDYYYDESREITKSPNELISMLETSWNGADPTPYTVGIFSIDAKGNFKAGHAIAAYGVEKVDANESRILVYDNNYPGLRQYIVVNTAANTWRYETAATPGEAGAVYTGTATSENLSIHDNSSRDLDPGTYYDCEFCNDAGGAAAATAAAASTGAARAAEAASGSLVFEYTGQGALVVTDGEDNRSGADFDSDDFLTDIPGTEVDHHKGGLGLDIPPTIRIPVPADTAAEYSAVVHGQNGAAATGGTLSITGPGFVIGVNDIDLAPDELFEFVVNADGTLVAFAATEDIAAPEVFISYDPVSDDDPSVIFDVGGIELAAGEEAVIELDPELEQVFFDHTGDEAEDFFIDMRLIWPDGDVENFEENIITPAGTNEAFLDFGAWDGLAEPALYIDGILTNPSIEHRLAMVDVDTDFRPEAGDSGHGVYDITATFENVTEVSLEDLSFSLEELDDEDELLGADTTSAMQVSVPDAALGEDGLLDPNETFEMTFSIALGDSAFGGAVFGADGTPFDWLVTDVAPSYEANNGPFVFAAASTRGVATSQPAIPVRATPTFTG